MITQSTKHVFEFLVQSQITRINTQNILKMRQMGSVNKNVKKYNYPGSYEI